MAIGSWLYDASDDYSKNSKDLNSAMLKAMKKTSSIFESASVSNSKKIHENKITTSEANDRLKKGKRNNDGAGIPDEFMWVLR